MMTLEELALTQGDRFLPKIRTSAAQRDILYGMAVYPQLLTNASVEPLISSECAILSSEGSFKMTTNQPTATTFSFTGGDQHAAYCAAHGMAFRIHVAYWGKNFATNLPWIVDALAADWQYEADRRMQSLTRYSQAVSCDVINEPLTDDGTGYRTDDVWLTCAATPETFIAYGLAKFRALFPATCKAVINEFGTCPDTTIGAARRTKMLSIAEQFDFDVVGEQAHLKLSEPFSETKFRQYVQSIRSNGKRLNITEFDIYCDVSGLGNDELDRRCAELAKRVVGVVLDEGGSTEFIQWGTNDPNSWLQRTTPPPTLTQRPLLHDSSNRPKMVERALRVAFA